MNYLSDIVPINSFESLTNEKDYLLIANTGSGKTHLMLEKFVSWAKSENKKVLYLYNRKSMKQQFVNDYLEKHENLTANSYQYLEKKYANNINEICSGNIDYLKEYDFILCDECHYFVLDSDFNKDVYISFELIKRSSAIRLFFTATPEPFNYVSHYLIKELEIIDLSILTEKSIETIYICKKRQFRFAERFFLKTNTIIHFENDNNNNEYLRDFYESRGYRSISLNSNNLDTISNSILSNPNTKNVPFEFISTTSVCENGINFNVDGEAMVSFPKFMNWSSLEQSAARLRSFNGNNISMLYSIPNYHTLRAYSDGTYQLLVQTSQNIKLVDNSKNFITCLSIYDFKFAKLKYEQDIYNEIFKFYDANNKDLSLYFEQKLQKIYPDAKIQFLHEEDLVDVVGHFDKLMRNSTLEILDKQEIESLKLTLGLSVKKINTKLEGKYFIDYKRKNSKTNPNKKISNWIIEKLQK